MPELSWFLKRITQRRCQGISAALMMMAIIAGTSLLWSQSIPKAASRNRVILAEADKVKVLEFNPVTLKFDPVWESAGLGRPLTRTLGIGEIRLADIDGDGKNELLAIDPAGVSIWGKCGKYPKYYNFESSMLGYSYSQILPIDIDGDSIVEFVTQGRWRSDTYRRQVTVWKPFRNGLKKMSELSLSGWPSWSLVSGDCDNDDTSEIVTSSALVNILKWIPAKGLVEKTNFPNVANLIDVIRIADADNDGLNEIIASGNGRTFSIHKPRDPLHYPVSYQNEPFYSSDNRSGYTQGLLVADIDGNGKNEILVGLAGKSTENVLAFEMVSDSNPKAPKFRKIFGMPEESSSIPGFIAGDADNDGLPEVIYNGRKVFKFSRDDSNSLQCRIVATLTASSAKAAIGIFEPGGPDILPGNRVSLGYLNIEIPKDGLVFAGRAYKCWLSLKSTWRELKNVKIVLDSSNKEIKVESKPIHVDSIKPDQEWNNQQRPFTFRTGQVRAPTRFRMTATLTADGGSRVIRDVDRFFNLFPELTFASDTLAVSDKDEYKALNFPHDLFLNASDWPPSETVSRHRNIILYDDYGLAVVRKDDLQSFLDNAGNFFVHGYGVIRGWDEPGETEAQRFISRCFKAKVTKDFVGQRLITGAKGDRISDGLILELQRNEYNLKSGVIEPLAGAIPIFYYPTGEVAGIRIDGSYKMVYLEFALRDIKSLEYRKELVRRILAWFGGK